MELCRLSFRRAKLILFANAGKVMLKHKETIEYEDCYFIKEVYSPYNTHFDSKMDSLRVENTIKWDVL